MEKRLIQEKILRKLMSMKLQHLKDEANILTLDGNYILTLPSMIIKAKGWKKGDKIKVEVNKDGDVVLKTLK